MAGSLGEYRAHYGRLGAQRRSAARSCQPASRASRVPTQEVAPTRITEYKLCKSINTDATMADYGTLCAADWSIVDLWIARELLA